MFATEEEWTISVQEPGQNQKGDIIIEKPLLSITSGKDKKWVALLGNPNKKEVQNNAKVMFASRELLSAAQEAYMLLATDRPISDQNDVREKLYRAIQKATK